jgi:ER lumen protein retaining receptor
MQLLLILWRTVEDHDTLFILAESVHFLGIFVLGYKLQRKNSVAGACAVQALLYCRSDDR